MSNAPQLDFWILYHQMETYEGLKQPSHLIGTRDDVTRRYKYRLEQELTTLDFLKDELRELIKDAEIRSRFVSEQLDSLV